jgi:elongation factor P
MIKASELRKGKTCIHDGQIYVCHEIHHVSKGNKRSYMQAKLKNYKTGQITDVRFNVDDRMEVPFVQSKEFQYLYKDGTGYVLMDTSTYDQITVSEDLFGDPIAFLKDNIMVTAEIYEGNVISIELPHIVDLEIKDTPPVVKGATATNQPKDAILETGARVRVPAFIEPGDVVRIDTRSGDYLERAKS